MGKLKNSKAKEYELTDNEFNLLKIINAGLQYSTLRDKSVSGLLYLICHNRLDYPAEVNLMFEIDLDEDKGLLKVTEVADSK